MARDCMHHYIVVRRDLPTATICAQLAHAAGESFYQLAQAGVAQLRERGEVLIGGPARVGGNPTSGSTLGRRLSEDGVGNNATVVQTHPIQPLPDPSRTVVVILGARNEAKLRRLERQLVLAGVPHIAVREPDKPWDGALMAIGLMPGVKDDLSPRVNEFQLLTFAPDARLDARQTSNLEEAGSSPAGSTTLSVGDD
jgi:hypothetical protein